MKNSFKAIRLSFFLLALSLSFSLAGAGTGRGIQNACLKDAKDAQGVTEVWINYSDQWSEENWYPGY